MRYTAPKDTVVSGTDRQGAVIEISFAKGHVETKKPAEVALLDRLAADPGSPVEKDKGE